VHALLSSYSSVEARRAIVLVSKTTQAKQRSHAATTK